MEPKTTEKPANGALAVIPAHAAPAALAPRAPNALASFTPASFEALWDLADKLHKAALVPKACRGSIADTAIVLMKGLELGLSVTHSLSGLWVLDGKAAMYADTMVAVCLSRPDVCEYFRLVSADAKGATWEAKRVGQPAVMRTFTMEDAVRANLQNKDNWKHFPQRMCSARSKSSLATDLFPDLLAGTVPREVLEDEVIAEVASSPSSGFVAPAIPATAVVTKAPAAAKAIEQVAAPAPTIDGKPVEDAKPPAPAAREPGADDGELTPLEKMCIAFADAETNRQLNAAAATWKEAKDALPEPSKAVALAAYEQAKLRIAKGQS